MLQPPVQPAIQPVTLDQLIVHAFLDDLAAVEHVGPVGLLHRAQAMGDDQGGAVFQKLAQRVMQFRLGFDVEKASGARQ